MDLFTRGNPLNPYIIPFPDGWGLKGITWYAMSYLVGALLALALSSYRAYKDGYPKDFFINLFFFAFPMGIIGGRMWYVIASWQEFAAEPWRMFFIWEGGMAIQGGALLGIISGIGFVKVRRKGTNLLHAADWAVPTVLVAQMIGRWGNFVNAEVFGNVVDISAYGGLPGFVINQMGYNGTTALANESQMYVPLFLMEGLINIGGYFLLTHFFEDVLGKWHEHGDGLFGYFIWYGLTRIVLENIRFGEFNMHQSAGQSVSSAYVMAWVFFGVGLVLFMGNQICCKLYRKGKLHLPDGFVHFFVNGADGDPLNRKLAYGDSNK